MDSALLVTTVPVVQLSLYLALQALGIKIRERDLLQIACRVLRATFAPYTVLSHIPK
jgi:hypothetical protein